MTDILIIEIKEVIVLKKGQKMIKGGWYKGHQYDGKQLGINSGIIVMDEVEAKKTPKMTFRKKIKFIIKIFRSIIFKI